MQYSNWSYDLTNLRTTFKPFGGEEGGRALASVSKVTLMKDIENLIIDIRRKHVIFPQKRHRLDTQRLPHLKSTLGLLVLLGQVILFPQQNR